MTDRPSWDVYFMGMANYTSIRSHDPNRKVGCVVTGPRNEVLSTGYNGLCRGISNAAGERLERPLKYSWIEHAERNAIYNAAFAGIGLEGCTLYSTLFPCMDCARAIVQSGIKRLVTYQPDLSHHKWGFDYQQAMFLFHEAGTVVDYLEEPTT